MLLKLRAGLLLSVLLLMIGVTAVAAQEGRPTVTPIPRNSSGEGENRGTIQGLVYEDVNSDGKCIGTGVEGEGPVANINIDFTNSDGNTLVTLYSGADGIYGLVAAGHGYWEVKAVPDAEWVVTSENPRWAPLDDNTRVQTDVNFCVQKANTYRKGGGGVLLPEAGAPSQNNGLLYAAMGGLMLILIGSGLSLRERAAIKNRD